MNPSKDLTISDKLKIICEYIFVSLRLRWFNQRSNGNKKILTIESMNLLKLHSL